MNIKYLEYITNNLFIPKDNVRTKIKNAINKGKCTLEIKMKSSWKLVEFKFYLPRSTITTYLEVENYEKIMINFK